MSGNKKKLQEAESRKLNSNTKTGDKHKAMETNPE